MKLYKTEQDIKTVKKSHVIIEMITIYEPIRSVRLFYSFTFKLLL